MHQILFRFMKNHIYLVTIGILFILLAVLFFCVFQKNIDTETICNVTSINNRSHVSNPLPTPGWPLFLSLLSILSLFGGICWVYSVNKFSPFKPNYIWIATLCCFCIASFVTYTLLNTFGLLPLQQSEPVTCQSAQTLLPSFR